MTKNFEDLEDFKICFENSMKNASNEYAHDGSVNTPEEFPEEATSNLHEHFKNHIINRVVFAENGKSVEEPTNEKVCDLPFNFLDNNSIDCNHTKKSMASFCQYSE